MKYFLTVTAKTEKLFHHHHAHSEQLHEHHARQQGRHSPQQQGDRLQKEQLQQGPGPVRETLKMFPTTATSSHQKGWAG